MKRTPIPSLFIIGPPKTATTSIAFWLSQHPSFFVSEPKEPLFFEFEFNQGVDFYLWKYFRHWNDEKILVDARPMHILVGFVPDRIKLVSPDAKFIVVVRDPWVRAYSDWANWNNMRPGRVHGTFSEAIQRNIDLYNPHKFDIEADYIPFCDDKGGMYNPVHIEASLYANMIGRYVELFGLENILFLDFDELIKNGQAQIDKISLFMGVDWHPIFDLSIKNMSPKKTKTPSRQKIRTMIKGKDRTWIDHLFSKDIELMVSKFNVRFARKYI